MDSGRSQMTATGDVGDRNAIIASLGPSSLGYLYHFWSDLKNNFTVEFIERFYIGQDG